MSVHVNVSHVQRETLDRDIVNIDITNYNNKLTLTIFPKETVKVNSSILIFRK